MASQSSVVVLDYWVSPFSLRARLALAEKGVAFEVKAEDLPNKSELLLKSNPVYKKVPVLIHEGKAVCESLNIVQYVDEVWSDRAPLLPSEPYERAQARFWADYIDKKAFDCGSKLWKLKGEAQEAAKTEFREILKNLEGVLGENKFFGGEAFGFLDIAFAPFVPRFYVYETLADFDIEKESPKVAAWAKRCLEKESVSKELPDPQKVYEFVLSMKKRLGIE